MKCPLVFLKFHFIQPSKTKTFVVLAFSTVCSEVTISLPAEDEEPATLWVAANVQRCSRTAEGQYPGHKWDFYSFYQVICKMTEVRQVHYWFFNIKDVTVRVIRVRHLALEIPFIESRAATLSFSSFYLRIFYSFLPLFPALYPEEIKIKTFLSPALKYYKIPAPKVFSF